MHAVSMIYLAAVVCTLWCIDIAKAVCHASRHHDDFEFVVISRRNSSGQWVAELQFNHESEHKEVRPWTLGVKKFTDDCENFDTIRVVATVTVPSKHTHKKQPPSDYHLLPGLGYYKLHKNMKNFDGAWATCAQEGAYLAVMNSETEALALVPWWVTFSANNFPFIGLYDPKKNGRFVTVFNETQDVAGYNKWLAGEPDAKGVQNCGLLSTEGTLSNGGCDSVKPFICEFES
ncbi:hemolymph lipopolysaccharide-binding protein-like [Periplaneta americana]|uniref:hemolymph lipopolysaccharide-binding protein-like n=1 Tax=Periplaneta americana TaxID=6978 RepID=UPI0037E9C7B2